MCYQAQFFRQKCQKCQNCPGKHEFIEGEVQTKHIIKLIHKLASLIVPRLVGKNIQKEMPKKVYLDIRKHHLG
jgi:hypothetical protein